MTKDGVIEASGSEWAAPIVVEGWKHTTLRGLPSSQLSDCC